MSTKQFIQNMKSQVRVIDDDLFIGDMKVEHVWLQGVVCTVDRETREFLIDDGTDNIFVTIPKNQQHDSMLNNMQVGMYLMIQGSIVIGELLDTNETVVMIEARIINILQDCNLESLWQIEVIEAMKRGVDNIVV